MPQSIWQAGDSILGWNLQTDGFVAKPEAPLYTPPIVGELGAAKHGLGRNVMPCVTRWI